jgi:hypothetical protein
MRLIRIFGLTVIVVLAVVARSSTVALASENPVLVTAGGGVVTNLDVTSKNASGSEPALQTTGGEKVACKGETDSGKVTTTKAGEGMTSGTATWTFTGCESAAGKCKNTNTSGEITGTVSILLVWIGKESEKEPGILVSILPFTGAGRGLNALLSFVCGSALRKTNVEGAFIALTSSTLNGAASTKSALIATQTTGAQKDKKYTENGKEALVNLFSSWNGGAFEESGVELESEEAYAESVHIVENA